MGVCWEVSKKKAVYTRRFKVLKPALDQNWEWHRVSLLSLIHAFIEGYRIKFD